MITISAHATYGTVVMAAFQSSLRLLSFISCPKWASASRCAIKEQRTQHLVIRNCQLISYENSKIICIRSVFRDLKFAVLSSMFGLHPRFVVLYQLKKSRCDRPVKSTNGWALCTNDAQVQNQSYIRFHCRSLRLTVYHQCPVYSVLDTMVCRENREVVWGDE